MTSESSYAIDCNKSLYILVTLNFHPTVHKKTIEITKKKLPGMLILAVFPLSSTLYN